MIDAGLPRHWDRETRSIGSPPRAACSTALTASIAEWSPAGDWGRLLGRSFRIGPDQRTGYGARTVVFFRVQAELLAPHTILKRMARIRDLGQAKSRRHPSTNSRSCSALIRYRNQHSRLEDAQPTRQLERGVHADDARWDNEKAPSMFKSDLDFAMSGFRQSPAVGSHNPGTRHVKLDRAVPGRRMCGAPPPVSSNLCIGLGRAGTARDQHGARS